tara:strand:+ start:2200 stop:2358 length:159 start_codon:yes stop_codon:yes gene_type:complete
VICGFYVIQKLKNYIITTILIAKKAIGLIVDMLHILRKEEKSRNSLYAGKFD